MPKAKKTSLSNTSGLTIDFLNNGAIKNIHAGPIRINLKAKNPLGKLGANLYLRKRGATIDHKPLLGPESNSRFFLQENSFNVTGSWDGISYVCTLRLSQKSQSFQWHIALTNGSDKAVELDMIYMQDVGLEPIINGRKNEYYISQYIERRILNDYKYGAVICCRQNYKGLTGNPWVMIASKGTACAASVDGMQFYGSTFKETEVAEGLLMDKLGGEYSGELSILALQETPFTLTENQVHICEFLVKYLPDHPLATTIDDLGQLPALMKEFDHEVLSPALNDGIVAEKNIFSETPLLQVDDLSEKNLISHFGKDRRHVEKENGQLLSFFCQESNHVVLRAKEAIVERPHAHIMQAQTEYIPDQTIMTTTSYMYGVFNSHITQGNTNFNRLLSVNSSQFNLETQTGQRLFVEIAGQLYRLGVPSAFEMGLNHCRWIYRSGIYCFQIRTWTSKVNPQINLDFKVLDGGKINLLITNHFDEDNGWHFNPKKAVPEIIVRPKSNSLIASTFPQAQFRILLQGHYDQCQISGDEILYNNHKSQDNNHKSLGGSFLVLSLKNISEFCMSFVGEVVNKTQAVIIKDADKQWKKDCKDAQSFWQGLSSGLSLKGDHDDLTAISEILPWYSVNALTHLLTPHGLEQFDGAAWGTRDTAQGPVELLIAMRKFGAVKQILRIVFSNQDADGGWPQWWMFDSYVTHRSDFAHADIFHWCLIALSSYIKASDDTEFLEEILPYYHAKGIEHAEKMPLKEHVTRLIDMITGSFIAGTSLVPFGGGDWNDAMQPVNQELAQRLISSWTVELNYQAFMACREIYERIGHDAQSEKLRRICEKIKTDFNKYLIKDDTVSGHGLMGEDGNIELLLHPHDTKTNIQYRLLPMMRGIISGIFTPEQALHHLTLIETHLKGPDGARLMNRPPKYNGGIQKFFQRAESSPFFGREIGIMYTHAHLRYAETQARTGRATALLKALRQAIPVGYRDVVRCGNIRQANCYYSSSDATFRNRYEADEKYTDIKTGKITLKGGWRIYSSGPGIFSSLIISHFLGMRDSFGNTVIDPVIPHEMNGMSSSLNFMGHHMTFLYETKEDCAGPKSISINNIPIDFTREENKYRLGGALIPTEKFIALLDKEENIIKVQL